MYQGWENERFNELFEMEKGEVDQAVRAQHLKEMTDILVDEVHYLPTTGGIGNYIQWGCVKGYTASHRAGTEQLPPRPHLDVRRGSPAARRHGNR